MHSFSFYSLLLILSFVFSNSECIANVRGIYVNQQSIHNTKKLNFLIKMAKSTMINTFVVDLHRMTDAYEKNISLLKEANIDIHTRIIVFPGGGNEQQVHSREYIKKRIGLAQQAAKLGSKVIQLDYIRYSTKRKKSPDNAKDILSVIQQFKEAETIIKLPLHIAVFGEALYSASTAIGQDIPLFSPAIDGIAPMLYPSHFKPYKKSSHKAYNTIYNSLLALKVQFNDNLPFDVIPYFEIFNVRVPMTKEIRLIYIQDQIKAIEDHKVGGWIAWSATNKYGYLFEVLESMKQKNVGEEEYETNADDILSEDTEAF